MEFSMLFVVVVIMLFLFVFTKLCEYAPAFAASNIEKQFIRYKIKYPNVFIIQ